MQHGMQHGDTPHNVFEFFDFHSSALPDHYPLDIDGDGFADIDLRDTDGNGLPDQLSIDVNSNASADLTIEARRGLLPDSIKIDLNGDGHFDVSAFDTDRNLWPDLVAADLAGDGRHEAVIPLSLDGLVSHLTGEVEPIASWGDIEAGMSAVPATSTPDLAPSLALAPSIEVPVVENAAAAWDDEWHLQTHSDTCAICCQEFIIEGLLGIEVNEDELLKIATDLGVYDHGTRADSIGSLLSHFGLESNLSFDNTLAQLTAAVQAGHGVIVGVDADELWNVPDTWEDILNVPGSGATHAVQVIGMQTDSSHNVCVVLNDPGIPEGRGCVVPLEKFHSAWRDSHGLMCVTSRAIQA